LYWGMWRSINFARDGHNYTYRILR
jgi:hypothetical protein